MTSRCPVSIPKLNKLISEYYCMFPNLSSSQYHSGEFSDGDCKDKMSGDITHVKFRSTSFDYSKKIRYPVEKEETIDPG